MQESSRKLSLAREPLTVTVHHDMTTCLAENGAPGIKRSFTEVAIPQIDPVARGRIPTKFSTLTQNLQSFRHLHPNLLSFVLHIAETGSIVPVQFAAHPALGLDGNISPKKGAKVTRQSLAA